MVEFRTETYFLVLVMSGYDRGVLFYLTEVPSSGPSLFERIEEQLVTCNDVALIPLSSAIHSGDRPIFPTRKL